MTQRHQPFGWGLRAIWVYGTAAANSTASTLFRQTWRIRMTTTQPAPTSHGIVAAAESTANDLIQAMAALPANHPSRAALRDEAIEAWLPLANHLARRYS